MRRDPLFSAFQSKNVSVGISKWRKSYWVGCGSFFFFFFFCELSRVKSTLIMKKYVLCIFQAKPQSLCLFSVSRYQGKSYRLFCFGNWWRTICKSCIYYFSKIVCSMQVNMLIFFVNLKPLLTVIHILSIVSRHCRVLRRNGLSW